MDIGALNNMFAGTATSPANKTNEVSSVLDAPLANQTLTNNSTPEPDREQMLDAVAGLQEYVQAEQYNIQFQLDDDSSRMVVKVTEVGSGEVIRQIPSEEALRLAENLSEIRSVLFSGKV